MPSSSQKIIIIGAGPTGLMAAEVLAQKGCAVAVYEHMASPARKFLMAGRGGLNLTHSEALNNFLRRYGAAQSVLEPVIRAFPPEALRRWCEDLKQPTFIGTSGRVFPKALKASPLLRAWLQRLATLGVAFHTRRRWKGWDREGALVFEAPFGKTEKVKADAVLLALGGASWPKLGSDGSWTAILKNESITVNTLRSANCGFEVAWSSHLKKFEGQPLKPVAITFNGHTVQAEAMITAKGIEGGAVYSLSSAIRTALESGVPVVLSLDLRPGISPEQLRVKFARPRGRESLSTYLKALGFSKLGIALLQEAAHRGGTKLETTDDIIRAIKHLPLPVTKPFPIARAISSAGGIALDEINAHFMLNKKPGVFVAGEMLDWEAPTGGYLLQACFSTAQAAARGLLQHLDVA